MQQMCLTSHDTLLRVLLQQLQPGLVGRAVLRHGRGAVARPAAVHPTARRRRLRLEPHDLQRQEDQSDGQLLGRVQQAQRAAVAVGQQVRRQAEDLFAVLWVGEPCCFGQATSIERVA